MLNRSNIRGVADQHSPWQRGFTRAPMVLMRQCLPNGGDLSGNYSDVRVNIKGAQVAPDALKFRQHYAAFLQLVLESTKLAVARTNSISLGVLEYQSYRPQDNP
jgi:hypothetical protein